MAEFVSAALDLETLFVRLAYPGLFVHRTQLPSEAAPGALLSC